MEEGGGRGGGGGVVCGGVGGGCVLGVERERVCVDWDMRERDCVN